MVIKLTLKDVLEKATQKEVLSRLLYITLSINSVLNNAASGRFRLLSFAMRSPPENFHTQQFSLWQSPPIISLFYSWSK